MKCLDTSLPDAPVWAQEVAHEDLMRFKETKCKVLHLGEGNPHHKSRLGNEDWEQPCQLGSKTDLLLAKTLFISHGGRALGKTTHKFFHLIFTPLACWWGGVGKYLRGSLVVSQGHFTTDVYNFNTSDKSRLLFPVLLYYLGRDVGGWHWFS